MEFVIDQISAFGWLTSWAGLAAVATVTGLTLSGLPARLMLTISARMPW